MIGIDNQGDVRIVTLDRADRRNAITLAGLEALETAVSDPGAPVICLRGAGEAFCAGADLGTVGTLATEGNVEPFVRQGQRTADAIENSPATVIAGIDGAARGGGIELALACDIRVATPEATFGEPGVTFGLFGSWGGTVRLPEIVGMGDALDFSLSGRVLDSEEALRIGLISRVIDDPLAVAKEVADNDPAALEHIKARIRDRSGKEIKETAEIESFRTLVETHAEKLREFGDSP
ncbi:enoyl-CoA hydratase/isomerase family protein [Natronomonas sp.]|uniref:enoyl-CoA hydratase/isomerase family protein n=1 Tax=Natronomonas sp. TaxID=2184060 RepID=UPI0039760E48